MSECEVQSGPSLHVQSVRVMLKIRARLLSPSAPLTVLERRIFLTNHDDRLPPVNKSKFCKLFGPCNMKFRLVSKKIG